MAAARMGIAFRAAPLVLLFVGGLGIAHAGQYPEAVLAPHGNELLRQSFGPTEIDFSGIMVALHEGADPNLAIDGVPVTYLAAQRRRLDIAETLLLDGGAAPPPCTPAMGACPVTAIVDRVRKLGGFTNHVTGSYTRTMVPPDLIPGGYGSETKIHAVYRVRERIDALGNYRLLELKKIDTPPLVRYRTCCALL